MTAKVLQEAARRLVSQKAGFEPIKAAPTKGARPGEKTTGRPSSAAISAAGSLVESDAALREYFPEVSLASTDGIFTLEVSRIKKVYMVGGAVLEFKNPP